MVADVQEQATSRSRGLLQPRLCVEQFSQRPGPRGKFCGHRRSCALQRLVSSNEIVIGEVERQGSVETLPLLAEPVRQTGQPPHAHAHGKVLPFYMRCADLFLIWVSVDWCRDRLGQARRTVAPCVLGNIQRVDLDELRVINALALMSEYIADCQVIGGKSVGSELKFLRGVCRSGQLRHESRGTAYGAFAQVSGALPHRVAVTGNENPLSADVC